VDGKWEVIMAGCLSEGEPTKTQRAVPTSDDSKEDVNDSSGQYDCSTEEGREMACLDEVLAAMGQGYNVKPGSEEYEFSSLRLEAEDQWAEELYVRGCHMFTSGELQGVAFYGGPTAAANPNPEQVVTVPTACSSAPPPPPVEDEAAEETQGKVARAKADLGIASEPEAVSNPPTGKKGGPNVWPIIVGVVGGVAAWGLIAFCLIHRKGRGKKGYGTPDKAVKKTADAPMDSEEGPNVNENAYDPTTTIGEKLTVSTIAPPAWEEMGVLPKRISRDSIGTNVRIHVAGTPLATDDKQQQGQILNPENR